MKAEMLMKAVAFAARAHDSQMRKDGKTPYVSHPFRVCLTLVHVFGITDSNILTAAILHDTLEDTDTDYDDLKKEFSEDVAHWVATVSKDKRLEEQEREDAYVKQIKKGEREAQLVKAADIYDNLMDSAHLSSKKRQKVLAKYRRYLKALDKIPPSIKKQINKVLSQ